MEKISSLLLEALRTALEDESVNWTEDRQISPQEWISLFRMAETHNILPMIYEAVYSCPAVRTADPQMLAFLKQKVVRTVILQSMRTEEALRMLAFLESRNLHPLVVKGIICRNLYPKPDCRVSGDEDVWIPWEEYMDCHRAMLEFGMEPSDPEQDIEKADEVPYGRKDSPIYIEMHKSLFPLDSKAYGDLNRFFTHARERSVRINNIAAPGYTDHLFYLICHAFKHFLHSGFGIRQVCDIVLFANAYGSQIDWDYVLDSCRQIRADQFAASIFRIGEKYLTFDPKKAGYPDAWSAIHVDETMMLQDLLEAGVFGDGSMSRKHSSTITLEAVSAQKEGRKASHGVMKSLFPPAHDLEKRFEYLKSKPWLLPAAWVQRIAQYRRETKGAQGNNAAEAVEIGNQRVELLKQYGIIDQ